MTAEKTTTIAFRVPANIKDKVDKKYNTFEKRKQVIIKLREFYATLLKK